MDIATDGGTTWTFPGALENGVFRSDPVTNWDEQARFSFSVSRQMCSHGYLITTNPCFNLVSKYFADNSRQRCRLRLGEARQRGGLRFVNRESPQLFNLNASITQP
jgi:hypothetical protein